MKNEVNQVDGKFYKRSKVVILPTKNHSHIINFDGRLHFNKSPTYPYKQDDKVYHLYFLSDEDIKEGDWVIRDYGLYQEIDKADSYELATTYSIYKIIATTDESLKIKVDGYRGELLPDASFDIVLPRPYNEFLKKYCELGGIDEVMVEYDNSECLELCGGMCAGNCPHDTKFSKLKIAPDNTITIKPVKEKIYSEEEVEKLCKRAFNAGWNNCLENTKLRPSIYADDWIKENL